MFHTHRQNYICISQSLNFWVTNLKTNLNTAILMKNEFNATYWLVHQKHSNYGCVISLKFGEDFSLNTCINHMLFVTDVPHIS